MWRNFFRPKTPVLAQNKPKILWMTIGYEKMYQNNLVRAKVFYILDVVLLFKEKLSSVFIRLLRKLRP